MANPYLHKVSFDRGEKRSRTIQSCRSLAKYINYQLGLEDGQISANKGATSNVYIYFVKNNKLHTIVWERCFYTSWTEESAKQIVDLIKNIP
jgi:hypothetical protein